MASPSTFLLSERRLYRKTLRELRRAAIDFQPGSDERFERLRLEAKELYKALCFAEIIEAEEIWTKK